MTTTPDVQFEITVPAGPMLCGYCGATERWRGVESVPSALTLGYLRLTRFHALGVGPAGELVVLAEATDLSGKVAHLPHLCEQIPDSVRAEYADDIRAIVEDLAAERVEAAA